MVRTISRWPTSMLTGPAYSAAPVSMSVPNNVAFTQCSVRSTRSKRRNVFGGAGWSTATSGGTVVPSVRSPDPAVRVVSPRLPVTLLDVLREHDGGEPLQRLVAVHRRDVETHRATVLVGERRT